MCKVLEKTVCFLKQNSSCILLCMEMYLREAFLELYYLQLISEVQTDYSVIASPHYSGWLHFVFYVKCNKVNPLWKLVLLACDKVMPWREISNSDSVLHIWICEKNFLIYKQKEWGFPEFIIQKRWYSLAYNLL